MNNNTTLEETPSPTTNAKGPEFCVERQLWRVKCGEQFEDGGGQRFEKITEIINQSGQRRHVVQCLWSPLKGKLGPVCAAFFTEAGTVLYLGGGRTVLVRPIGDVKCEITLRTDFGRGRAYGFRCDAIVDGVPVNPRLPRDFDSTANEERPEDHRVWWDVPFVQTYADAHPKFLEAWPSGTRYDLRCLDGGAWDRPTCWGMFGSLEEAVAQAPRGPVSRTCAISPAMKSENLSCGTAGTANPPMANGEAPPVESVDGNDRSNARRSPAIVSSPVLAARLEERPSNPARAPEAAGRIIQEGAP
jgi:hypothetical protein